MNCCRRARQTHQDGAIQEAGLHQRAVLRLHGRVVEAQAALQDVLQLPAGRTAGRRLQALVLRRVAHKAALRPGALAVRQQALRGVHRALARAARQQERESVNACQCVGRQGSLWSTPALD